MDALRADHLGAYGYAKGTSRVLDDFSRRGTLFENAYAQASWTKPSVASILTSRYPTAHQALAGRAIASELLLLGERFDPELALRIGLVNRVLPASELYEHALARAKALAELPPASVRLTKELMRTCDRASTTAALVRESEVFFERLKSPEAAEAMQAFFAKRKPDFSRFE